MYRGTHWSLVLLTAIAVSARAEEFVIRPGGESKAVFASHATMESFEGRTSKVSGVISGDPAGVGDSVGVRVEVDLASLDTGIAMRNRHMRENHLETDRYPTAVFAGARVASPAGAKLEPGQPTTFEIEGTFSLHGVSRRLRTKVEVTLVDAGGARALRFRATFPVALSDYAISRPQFLFLRLADVQQVTVSGVATPK